MAKLFILIIMIIILSIIWALPLYLCVNFILWCFHIQFHITIIQSFALMLLANAIHDLLFERKARR